MIKMKSLGAQLRDGALLQASFATYLSFKHIYLVATMVGQTGASGWIYPPSVDLLTYSAYRRIKAARPGESRKAGITAFLLASTASLGANVIAVLPHSLQAPLAANLALRIVVGAWAWVAVVVSVFLGHTSSPLHAALDAPVVRAELVESAEAQDEDQGHAVGPEPDQGQDAHQEPEPQHDEHPVLQLVLGDTPEESEPEVSDTPGPGFPKQWDAGFYKSVIALVSAGQPVDTFPSVTKFCDAVNVWLVSHEYRPVSRMTIRRAMPRPDKKAV